MVVGARTRARGALAWHRIRLPAAVAIVIVGGLMAVLIMSIFLLPTLYVWIARPGDALPDVGRTRNPAPAPV
jgi:hypothetical protein